MVDEHEAKAWLEAAGLRVPRRRACANRGEAHAALQELGPPVVVKVLDPAVTHKSDVGGVHLGVASPDHLDRALDAIDAIDLVGTGAAGVTGRADTAAGGVTGRVGTAADEGAVAQAGVEAGGAGAVSAATGADVVPGGGADAAGGGAGSAPGAGADHTPRLEGEVAGREAPPRRRYLVEETVGEGVELLVGARRDPAFGPIVALGLGGLATEVLDDVAVRLAPLTAAQAAAMADELAGRALLDGFRGRPPVDRHELAAVLITLGTLLQAHDEVAEIEVNPLIATAGGLVVADALVVLRT